MDNETKQALLSSIEKWTSIVAGPGEDEGRNNCALCEKFIQYHCEGCPVKAKTGKGSCFGSPYTEWWEFMLGISPMYFSPDDLPIQHRDRAIELAQAELEFLKSLLEQEEPKS